jgi:hypothetical protein
MPGPPGFLAAGRRGIAVVLSLTGHSKMATTTLSPAPPRRAAVLRVDVQHPLSSRDQLGN